MTIPTQAADDKLIELLAIHTIASLEQRVNEMDVVRHLGIRLCGNESGSMCARIEKVLPFHLGGQERPIFNGATLMGLLDCAMAAAAIHRVGGQRCATLEISIKFMKPAIAGEINAVGKVMTKQGDILFCEGNVYDKRQKSVAIAHSIFKLL